MFGLSLSHLIIVFVVILLFGSRRLPELGSSVGRAINAFKKGLEGGGDDKDNPEKQLADSSRKDDSGQPPSGQTKKG